MFIYYIALFLFKSIKSLSFFFFKKKNIKKKFHLKVETVRDLTRFWGLQVDRMTAPFVLLLSPLCMWGLWLVVRVGWILPRGPLFLLYLYQKWCLDVGVGVVGTYVEELTGMAKKSRPFKMQVKLNTLVHHTDIGRLPLDGVLRQLVVQIVSIKNPTWDRCPSQYRTEFSCKKFRYLSKFWTVRLPIRTAEFHMNYPIITI
jgi:hypothetical protein